ncbi:hypothetical protein QTG54_007028 [Skeletonema marinoi]|uniref:Uncharacterized protein n=1 Tax=Skeletonema marinoi TaxID=267567 RepID=A0AAD8YA67_9STRA|nr:hypothetical protein QTG54_007028 [Skeletonema marinoi]
MADTAKIIEENAAAPSEDDGSLPVAAELDSTSFLPDDDAEEAPSDSLGTALSVPVADASLDNASSDNNSDGPDTNVEGWFSRHALPVTEGVKISLDDWGVYCVEQLKLLPSDIFLGMFDPEKLIVRETAKIALEKLKEEGPVDLSKCVVAQVASASAKFRNKKETTADGKPSPKKIPRNAKHMMEARQTEGQDPILSLMVSSVFGVPLATKTICYVSMYAMPFVQVAPKQRLLGL